MKNESSNSVVSHLLCGEIVLALALGIFARAGGLIDVVEADKAVDRALESEEGSDEERRETVRLINGQGNAAGKVKERIKTTKNDNE